MRFRARRVRRRLTDVLVAMGVVDRELLEQAAAEFYDRKYGQWLVEHGLITEEWLTIALAQQAAECGEYPAASQQLADATEKLHQKELSHIDAIRSLFSRLIPSGPAP